MTLRPIMFSWQSVDVADPDSGEWRRAQVMVPLPRFSTLAKRQFVDREIYALGPVEEVSHNSRGRLFVEVRDAWNSLPEDDERFPSKEHLRKRALVGAGWAHHAQYVLDTPKDAREMARGLRRSDEYAVIKVSGNVVDHWTAKSIAGGAITAEEWKVVKPKALDWIAVQARTTRRELETHSMDGGAR